MTTESSSDPLSTASPLAVISTPVVSQPPSVRAFGDSLHGVQVAIVWFDLTSMTCTLANPAFEALVQRSDVLGMSALDLLGQEVMYEIELLLPDLQAGQSRQLSLQVQEDERDEQYDWNLTLSRFSQAPQINEQLVMSIADVTPFRKAQRSLRESEQMVRRFLDSVDEGVIVHDKGVLIDANEALLRLLSLPRNMVIGRKLLDFVAPQSRDTVSQYVVDRRTDPYEALILAGDGTEILIEAVGRDITLDSRTVRIAFVRDIRKRKNELERIDQLARTDTLTGLPNRADLMERTADALRKASLTSSPMGVLFIDLDRFKLINDSIGHHAGDEVLCRMAHRIVRCLRDEDIVGRLGGDEFLVVLPGTQDVEQVEVIAQRLIDSLSASVRAEGRELTVTPSIGISMFPRDGQSPEVLIQRADAAMYAAKEAGRATFAHYTPEISRAASDALEMHGKLREALRSDQFHLMYQPQWTTERRELCGTEALLRWRHPERGMMAPGLFLRIAEERGLIIGIGDWVLRESLRQYRQWLDQGIDLPLMALNVSPPQLHKKEFVTSVTEALKAYDIPGHQLEFEITESVILDDSESVRTHLSQIKNLGVRIALDDFGTGYSSLSYLRKYPIDRLKIDRSFVHDLLIDRDDLAIVEAIIGLGRTLGVDVVAEGVEDERQLFALRELGCDVVQGNYLGTAASPDQFEQRYVFSTTRTSMRRTQT